MFWSIDSSGGFVCTQTWWIFMNYGIWSRVTSWPKYERRYYISRSIGLLLCVYRPCPTNSRLRSRSAALDGGWLRLDEADQSSAVCQLLASRHENASLLKKSDLVTLVAYIHWPPRGCVAGEHQRRLINWNDFQKRLLCEKGRCRLWVRPMLATALGCTATSQAVASALLMRFSAGLIL